MSNTYYPALTQPNTELVTDPITEVRPHSIVTADGTEREVDTLILGTGFRDLRQPRVRAGPRPRRAQPRRGLGRQPARVSRLDDHRLPQPLPPRRPEQRRRLQLDHLHHRGHINYALGGDQGHGRRGRIDSVEVRPEVYDGFAREADGGSPNSVWNEGGCASWYFDENGRNAVWWPGFTWRLWQRTRRFDPGEYVRPARRLAVVGERRAGEQPRARRRRASSGSTEPWARGQHDRALDRGDDHRRDRAGALGGDAVALERIGEQVLPAADRLGRGGAGARRPRALERRGDDRAAVLELRRSRPSPTAAAKPVIVATGSSSASAAASAAATYSPA